MKKVAVIMGSDSDWPVVKGACQQLETFGIPYEAHRLLLPVVQVEHILLVLLFQFSRSRR